MSESCCNRRIQVRKPREFLQKSSYGFGSLALAYLLKGNSVFADTPSVGPINPLAPKRPPYPTKAKNVIFLLWKAAPAMSIRSITNRS